jgi:hypothetical protein
MNLFQLRNKENSPDDDQVTLIGSFADIIAQGVSWKDFFRACVPPRIVWTSVDCCCLTDQSEAPIDHNYAVDLVVQVPSIDSKQNLRISAQNAQAAVGTLAGLLLLLANGKDELELTFQSFATQPRHPFPPLASDTGLATVLSAKHKIVAVRLQFVDVDDSTCQLLAKTIPRMEYRQCTVEGLHQAVASNKCPSKLTISCTLQEFAKFGTGLGGNSVVRSIDLLLHFWLQGEPLHDFCRGLEHNLGLETLVIRYLDINDDGWTMLFHALRFHPTLQTLCLQFTDDFVDNFRRLTPERRTQRTQVVLDFLEENRVVQNVTWPIFQQDQELMEDITSRLERNRGTGEEREHS